MEYLDDFCAVTEIKDNNFHRTRVSIYSFIQHNQWFDGRILILTDPDLNIDPSFQMQLDQIYDKIEIVKINKSDFDPIIKKINKKKLDGTAIEDYLYLLTLKIKSKGNLYFSSNIVFTRDISDILSDSYATFVLKSGRLPMGSGSEVNSNMFYLPGKFASDVLYEKSINNLSNNYNVFSSDSKALCILSALHDLKIEISRLPLINLVDASGYPDSKYREFLRYNKSISAINFNTLDSNDARFIRMNLYWSQVNKASLEYKPSQTIIKRVANPKNLRHLNNSIYKKVDKKHELGDWNPLLHDYSKSTGLHIVITTMMWKRHDIFKIWSEGIIRLKRDFPRVRISTVVVGSEGDVSRNLCESYGFIYVEHENTPLGSKANARLTACKLLDPDYVILIGSDDLISSRCFALMLSKMQKGYDEIAPLDIYYYNSLDESSTYSHGYQGRRRGEPVAAGRCLSKSILDRMDWKIWPDSTPKGLDSLSRDKIRRNRNNHYYYSCRENGVVICDVKSEINLTPFKHRYNYEKISSEYLFNSLPELNLIKKTKL